MRDWSIMFMAHGVNRITAHTSSSKLNLSSGFPRWGPGEMRPADGEYRLDASPRLASELSTQLLAMKAHGAYPFLCWDHDPRKKVGWVRGFFWGGESEAYGGIRARVLWNDFGRALMAVRTPLYCSPEFLFNTETRRVLGIGENVGAVVTATGFTRNEPIQRRPPPKMCLDTLYFEARALAEDYGITESCARLLVQS
jgi:hypothetical protein